MKKVFFVLILCVIMSLGTGCSDDNPLATDTDNSASMLTSTQPTDSNSENVSELNQSSDSASSTKPQNSSVSMITSTQQPNSSSESVSKPNPSSVVTSSKQSASSNVILSEQQTTSSISESTSEQSTTSEVTAPEPQPTGSISESTSEQNTTSEVTSSEPQPTESTTESTSEPNSSSAVTSSTRPNGDTSATSSLQSEPSESTVDNKTYGNCRLIVKGKDITAGNYVYLHEKTREFSVDADIPVTAILRELGATVEWQDGTKVVITHSAFHNGQMILDTSIPDFGIFLPPGGTYSVRKIFNNEIVMDYCSAGGKIKLLGVSFDFDHENKIIEIY